jgi:hypothetical protein
MAGTGAALAAGWAAVVLTVGMLAATDGAAQAASGTHATVARIGTRVTASKHIGAFPAVAGITTGSLQSYSVQSADSTVASGTQWGVTVTCPTGTVVVGGGVYMNGSDLSDNINTSSPVGTNAWQGFVNNSSGVSSNFTVYAVCAKAPRGYRIVHSALVDNPTGTQTSDIMATCPAGSKVLGGGGVLNSFDPNVALNSSFPVKSKAGTVTKYSWRIDANNASGGDSGATSFAICGKRVSGYRMVIGTGGLNPAGEETPAFVSCPLVNGHQTLIMGGGVESSSPSTLTSINSTYPVSNNIQWGAFENNGSGGNPTITPFVVCAL